MLQAWAIVAAAQPAVSISDGTPCIPRWQAKDYCQNRGVFTRTDCIADSNCAWCWGLSSQEGAKYADCFNLTDRPKPSVAAPGLTCDPPNPRTVEMLSINCSSLVSPIDPASRLAIFSVRPQSTGACVVECDATVNGTSVLPCVTFADSVVSIMQKAGLHPALSCASNTIEAPGGSGKTVISCPEWFLYAGWGRSVTRTLGSMRHELLLKTVPAFNAFLSGFGV